MPNFKKGSPQVTFLRKDGKTFKKTFHSAKSASNAVKGWRANGGSTRGFSNFSGKR